MSASGLIRVAKAAERIGLTATGLRRAIDRGELTPHPTDCGLVLLATADVDAWAKVERRPGRKPKAS